MKLSTLVLAFLFTMLAPLAHAEEETNALDELNPFDPAVEQELEFYDQLQMLETGVQPFDLMSAVVRANPTAGCQRAACAVWAKVDKSEQRLYLYVNGQLQGTWATSTGRAGFNTPNFDRHPDGRIYTKYTSKKYPGGDYNGLGNMPYAVFIQGGFAIHGTGTGNWPLLGQPASHGCIRVHPDNAKVFNALVRQYGIANTWITVQP